MANRWADDAVPEADGEDEAAGEGLSDGGDEDAENGGYLPNKEGVNRERQAIGWREEGGGGVPRDGEMVPARGCRPR